MCDKLHPGQRAAHLEHRPRHVVAGSDDAQRAHLPGARPGGGLGGIATGGGGGMADRDPPGEARRVDAGGRGDLGQVRLGMRTRDQQLPRLAVREQPKPVPTRSDPPVSTTMPSVSPALARAG